MGVVISTLRECLRPGSSPPHPWSTRDKPPPRDIPLSSITMEIIGELKFRSVPVPDFLPENSHLRVDFADVTFMDAPSVKLGESLVDVTNIYKKEKPLMYSVTCLKPASIQGRYSVSAVLNMGWKANGNEWIRRGDYFNDTTQPVELEDGKDFYKVDIEVVKYQ